MSRRPVEERAPQLYGSLPDAAAISSRKHSVMKAFWELPTDRQKPTGTPLSFIT